MQTNINNETLDADFIVNYVEFLKITKKKFGHQALLDKNFNIIFASDSVASCFRNLDESSILGLNFIDGIPRPKDIIDKKRILFNEVLNLNESRVYIAIHNNPQQKFRKFVICASPISNPKTGNIVAIELTGGPTNQNILQSSKEKNFFNNSEILNFLTNYELEVIYLKCKGKTDKEVSILLSNYYQKNITPKMITHNIHENIYYKMQVSNLKKLKAKAKTLGILALNINELLPTDDIIVLNNSTKDLQPHL